MLPRGKTILIVDDSALMRQIVSFTSKDAGYDVIAAENGKDALSKFEGAKVEMVITDLNMPEMDGTGANDRFCARAVGGPMEYALNISNDTGELILNGDATVESAQTLHGALVDPQGAVSELVVNMSGVRGIDVTCLQLLCSAHYAATKEGRKFKLANVSPATRDTIESLGFIRHIGCREDTIGSCLWLMGETV